ncbi:DNA repair protein RecO [Jeotgalibaca dankookensis]|nr:DNA repair protein RecO [Jeotgalibaca dankookensis]
MSKKQNQTFDAIVISVRKHKEKDALVKLFTQEHGKRMFFVRSYFKSNHALKTALLPFSYSTFTGSIQDQGLCFLQDYKASKNFRLIHEDVYRNAYATYLANLSDAAIEDGIKDEKLFQLLLQSYESIDKGLDAEIIVNIFEMHLLRYFGVHPQLDACRICGSKKEPFDFSARFSGVLCTNHFHEDPHRLHINPAAIYFSRMFLSLIPEQVSEISIRKENKQAIREFIDFLYDEYVGIRLKSKTYIDQMYAWEETLQIVVKDKKDKDA